MQRRDFTRATMLALVVICCFLTSAGIQAVSPPLLEEDFEAGEMPPVSWTRSIVNSDYSWQTVSGGAHSGTHSAWVDWERDALVPQNEWLVSPAMVLSEATLTFWSKGDLFWCRDVHNGCELFIWLVIGDVGGGDDIMIGKADGDWTASDVWSLSTFDLTPFLPAATPVRIGFNYMGWSEREDVGLDDIQLVGEGWVTTIFSDGFEWGSAKAWSESIP